MLMPRMGTSLHSMMQNMKLEMRWQQRQQNITKKQPLNEDPEITRMREEAAQVRKSNVISGLDAKLKSGMVLSDKEMAYLKANSPQLYQLALEVAQERKQYKEELENCKTKDEVERLNNRKLQSFCSEAKTVMSASLPQSQKLARMAQIQRRMAGVQDEHMKFISSPAYARLPREEDEKDEDRARVRKAGADAKAELDRLQQALRQEAQQPDAPAEKPDVAQEAPTTTPKTPDTPDGAAPKAVSPSEKPAPATPKLNIKA